MSICQSTRAAGAAIVLSILIAGCSTSPPVRVNADGQRVQRVCEEVQSASGSRVNSRECRDVVVDDGDADDAERAGTAKTRD